MVGKLVVATVTEYVLISQTPLTAQVAEVNPEFHFTRTLPCNWKNDNLGIDAYVYLLLRMCVHVCALKRYQ